MTERRHELVLLGASGFTGGLTAEYLARRAPSGLRWALAGRSRQKLETVRQRLAEIDPACTELPLLQADAGDPASIRLLAESTRVVITTVGPYILYGEPLVSACAAAGTDYVDLTGEPEFVDQMWLRHHEQAVRSGARIVHSCGFDSIPYDLGVLFTVMRLPEGVPLRVDGYVRAGGTFSGGTYHSAINSFARVRQASRIASERRRFERRPAGRRVNGLIVAPHRDAGAGGWVVPFPGLDPQTVLRSGRALERYGPDFTYAHHLVVGSVPVLAGMIAGAGATIALAQIPPTRDLLLKLRRAGEGPSSERRARGFFRVRFVGEGGGRRVVTEVSGSDPYGESAKMLAESALCLAHDELPPRGGQLTPAVAMGQALIDRLQGAGIEFRVAPDA
ncbi:MAG: saccharopine dehydrogenase [Solirubrobacterales bacterium]|nr:MAG: saccharopine dehydrogenase [Solirubrobacterales bacterium]